MDDEVDELLVEVRAETQGFAADMAAMRANFDATLLDGFGKAGDVLRRGLIAALRDGKIDFEDLGRIATAVLDRIAAQALKIGFDGVLGDGAGVGGLGGLLSGAVGALFGLPGRAAGGIVSPERPYLVGERGPELFVPASAGQVVANGAGGTRNDVRVAITVSAPRGTSAPVALQRSSRQVAAAIRRNLLL